MAINSSGSSWRKWDLHIHTPYTKLNPQYTLPANQDLWEAYCKKLDSSDVSVFGITDYFSIENYFTFIQKFKTICPDSKKVFFPNLELRLDVSVNKNGEEINIHIIFSNEVSKEYIDAFLSRLPTNISVNGAVKCCNQLSTTNEYEKAAVSIQEIKKCLNAVFGNQNCYLIFAAANNQGLRPTNSPRKMNISDEIDKVCDGFFGGITNRDYFLKTDRYEADAAGIKEKSRICPVVSGSDCHSFEDIDAKLGKHYQKKDSSGNICDSSEITWIKADTTFEGLRQIMYEPKERVFIGEHCPSPNIQKISKVELKFKDGLTIKRKNDVNGYPFCFSGIKQDLYLSDYFNCFIGGRGSGKSSLLNLLYKGADGGDKDFFENNELKEGDKDFVLNDNIAIEHSAADIEFLGQNEIEEFATDYEKFSMAIYSRLENQDKLNEKNIALIEKIQSLDDLILIVKEKRELEAKKLETQKTLSAYEKIVTIVKGEEYQAFQSKGIEVQNKLKKLRLSKAAYLKFKEDFSTFLQNFQTNSSPDNLYDTTFNDFLKKLQDIEKGIGGVDFTAVLLNENTLQDEYDVLRVQYNNFLTSQGVSAQKLSDISKAQEGINDLSIQISKIDKQINDLQSKIDTFSFTNIKDEYDSYNLIIEEELQKAQDLLMGIKNDNIGEISLKASFDFERAKSDIFNGDFWLHFKDYKDDTKMHWDKLYQILYKIDPKELLEETKAYTDFIAAISEGNLNGNIFLNNIFKDKLNFFIYKLIVAKYFFNLHKYLKINISYNQRPIESSSFGQKCTVVILIMILFGTKPIIIDEPEAHLDSSLIADYLVDLIKQRRKERQIIFATHNANFVINGDAEKIFILEMGSDNKTLIAETTIEDLQYREKLLKLEGGQVAFELRERKYHF